MISKLWFLFILNAVMFSIHIWLNCTSVFYFFQLTIIGQVLVVSNFLLSLLLHQKKSTLQTKLFLSRLHLITISLEFIVVIGFWGLRLFFTKGIIKQGEQDRDLVTEIMSIWVHGGSFLTMLYFIRSDQIVCETNKTRKMCFHLSWGVPFLFLQYLHWELKGEHVYGFLKYFEWMQLIIFELSLYMMAFWVDYFLTIRHGYKLSLKHLEHYE